MQFYVNEQKSKNYRTEIIDQQDRPRKTFTWQCQRDTPPRERSNNPTEGNNENTFQRVLFGRTMLLSAEETAVMTKDASSADQKFLISRELLHLAVSINIAALMTKLKRPKVSRTAGKVSTFRIDPKKLLIKPKSRATQRNFPAPP